MRKIKIGNRWIGEGEPAYIIAEIGSNFDGSIARAKALIDLAKECGADAAKFQCFAADKIVSKEAFDRIKVGFQSKWKKSVYEVYQNAEFPRDWHKELFDYTMSKGLHFLSAPYDFEAVDIINDLGVPALKIGSGDITWLEIIDYIAKKGKPIILGTGSSTIAEIEEAVKVIRKAGNKDIVLLQCITNYPSSFGSANIRAMKAMGKTFDTLVGYSDHTPGSIVPLGAVSLGGCVIEKHFTDDKTRPGPDHPFAMDGKDFKEMVDSIRTLEKALGSPVKDLYEEEGTTVIIQRRCLRASRDISVGEKITEDMVDVLRPSDIKGLLPKCRHVIVGREVKTGMKKGDTFTWEKI